MLNFAFYGYDYSSVIINNISSNITAIQDFQCIH